MLRNPVLAAKGLVKLLDLERYPLRAPSMSGPAGLGWTPRRIRMRVNSSLR
jgi:hypothetical protein